MTINLLPMATPDLLWQVTRNDAAKSAERIEKMMSDNNIRGTPTFEVNGKRLGGEEGGEQTLAQLDAAIAEASK